MEISNPFLTSQLRITEADLTEVDLSWSHMATYFPYYRMYYIVDGHAKIFMHDKTLELLPDHIYFIPAYSITGAECEQSMLHYWIHFNLDVTTMSYLTIYQPQLSAIAMPCDKEIFRMIVESFTDSQDGSHPMNSLAYVSLAKYLFSRFLPSKNISSKTETFLPVLEYIDRNLSSNISNADLCQIICLNETYFSNLFTKQFGISPKQYILQKRIGEAARMLLETDKTVKEIGFELGYDNEMYFNRIFHKITGMSPGKYRNNFRNN